METGMVSGWRLGWWDGFWKEGWFLDGLFRKENSSEQSHGALECVITVRPQTTANSLTLAKLPLRKYPHLKCRIITPLACEDPLVKESPLFDTVLCRIFSCP